MPSEAIVEIDARKRVSLARAGDELSQRYAMSVAGDGTITLTPVVVLTQRELAMLKNPDLMKRIRTGLGQASRGETRPWSEVKQSVEAVSIPVK